MSGEEKSRTGLIVAVVILSIVIVYMIVMEILAIALKKPIFHKLSIIGLLGEAGYKAVYKGQSVKDQFYHQIAKHSDGRLMQQVQQMPVQPVQPVDEFASMNPQTTL